jgi:DNA-binding transcriptional ArsR family regulator
MSWAASLDVNLVRALAHPLRWRILELITERAEASPVQLAREMEHPLATVSHHVRMLRDLGYVELVRTAQRRGAVEHFYRAVTVAFLTDEQWRALPLVVRRGLARQTFQRIFEDAATAGSAGGFDVAGAHIDRIPLALDDRGWQEISELLVDALYQAEEIQRRSDARRGRGSRVRPSELVLLHFSAPEGPDTGRAASLPERGVTARGKARDGS